MTIEIRAEAEYFIFLPSTHTFPRVLELKFHMPGHSPRPLGCRFHLPPEGPFTQKKGLHYQKKLYVAI